jgi:hypothetical protein
VSPPKLTAASATEAPCSVCVLLLVPPCVVVPTLCSRACSWLLRLSQAKGPATIVTQQTWGGGQQEHHSVSTACRQAGAEAGRLSAGVHLTHLLLTGAQNADRGSALIGPGRLFTRLVLRPPAVSVDCRHAALPAAEHDQVACVHVTSDAGCTAGCGTCHSPFL